MSTLFKQGRAAEIIVYFPQATKTASRFVAKITISTQLDELRQQAREFFQLQPNDCHIAFKDRKGLEVYVNQVNFQRIKENIHVEKLFKVIEYDPSERTIRQEQIQHNNEEEYTYKPFSKLKEILPIQQALNADLIPMDFLGQRFLQIVPALQSLGLLSKRQSHKRYQQLCQQMFDSTQQYLKQALTTFTINSSIDFAEDK